MDSSNIESGMRKRIGILIKGIVQGVGFRPFVYRSAQKYKLPGFVKNTSRGVILEVEGVGETIDAFIDHILNHPPPLAMIESHEIKELPIQFSETFEIVSSEDSGKGDSLVSPDIAICDNCVEELFLPENRRYRYPFINCTDCGPRFSIIRGLPYDRPKTTMKDFPMCGSCEREYRDPYDRRYHAQPVSCYECGPTLSLIGPEGEMGIDEDSLDRIAEYIRGGGVVAIKGLGGYHLACKASGEETVVRLRELKGRETKPFALMATMDTIMEYTYVSERERELLLSPAAPILLLKRKDHPGIAGSVAPGLSELGFMLPYTPLHMLLLEKVREPLVMTSANITDEPILYQDNLEELKKLSDYILTHDREIRIFADDSVAKVFENRLYMVRRSRGYVPLPLKILFDFPETVLALGPMLKTTFTFLYNGKALVGQYIGDTDSPASIEAEKCAIEHMMDLFSLKPGVVVVDKHPGYPNRKLAEEFEGAEIVEVQHHEAHVGALMAETGELGDMIGISMDGTGYGDDGNIWGGEFFVGNYRGLSRFAHLKYMFLPSGDKSAKEPWRFAMSVLYALYGDSEKVRVFGRTYGQKAEFLLEAMEKGAGGILTSSCGRLFDAAAVLLGMGDYNTYEGELPIKLQACAEKSQFMETPTEECYGFSIETDDENKSKVLDFLPMIGDILSDEKDVPERAYLFHWTLAVGFTKMAVLAAKEYNIYKVGLTGGVFQNTLLLELTKDLLAREGFVVLHHSEVPPNDGGISLGQAFLAAARIINKTKVFQGVQGGGFSKKPPCPPEASSKEN
jgi:hydrogenase maturation protein HypF